MRLIEERELIRRISELPDLRAINTRTIGKIIKQCRTIDAEPVRHGQWIEPYPNDIWDCYQCTCCKSTFGNTMNYCPNCGAKMMDAQDNKEE